ncbi:MAG: tRNA uridine-5-carboxymethylaminomethyl(34) synthesis GTPase MnmE, partial [Nitrospirae bacterium]
MTDFSLEDTIVAISTAPGEAAIGIVRLSGPQALSIISRIFKPAKTKDITKVPSHTIHYGWVISRNTGEIIDEVLVSIMKAPNTYTREDVVEINCHGGMVPLRKVLELAVKEGARIAKPGEFTLRAFINGRIDLAQAEAVLDLIRAKTDWSSTLALKQLQGGLSEKLNSLRQAIMNVTAHVEAYLDFPEEEIEPMTEAQILTQLQDILNEIQGLAETFYEGRLLREGLSVAIVGRPNVGKSSLLNKLLERDRAIVTDIPGTTRDVIEEYLNIKGLPIKVLDTAGIRASKDMIEEEGIRRSLKAIEEADLVLCVLDQSEPIQEEDRRIMGSLRDKKTVFVLNKADLPARLDRKLLPPDKPSVVVSAKSG